MGQQSASNQEETMIIIEDGKWRRRYMDRITIVFCLVIARCYRLLRSLWHCAIKSTSGKPLGTSR